MSEAMPVWDVPLDAAPVVRQMGMPTHGQVRVERWRNLKFWSMHAYRYRARVRVGEAWLEIEPGMVSVVPPGVELEYRFEGASRHTFVHFDLARRRRGGEGVVRLPALMKLGEGFGEFERDFREAVGWMPGQAARCGARVWDLLWRLTAVAAKGMEGERRAGHPVVERAVEWIELRMGERFTLEELAREMDVSRVHLVRLFRMHAGKTPLAYVHGRRAARAEHLLRHTTLPIKSVARHVGLVDLQQLNKLLRKELGQSPRAVRGV